MNKQQLAAKIWESANQMRSKVDANDYKDFILGFIFYKYLSDKQLRFMKAEGLSDDEICGLTEEDTEIVEHIRSGIGYFIAYKNLFSTWIDRKGDFDVLEVHEALSAFNRLIHPTYKRLFNGILRTLETGLSKLGETAAAQTKAISGLLYLIKDIPTDGRQGYDVLGFIYEYLIGMFAANAGKKAGEFYTPHEVSMLMSEIIAHHLRDRETIQIYDPTSGSGSLLLNIGQALSKHTNDKDSVKYFAQELKENTYNLTRMNLIMRDILPSNIVTRNADTLEDDWPFFEEDDPVNTYSPLYLDAVVSNPPYSQKWDPKNKETDPRYARFGLAPKSKADYAFLLHDLYHLKPSGIMAIILPHGVLFRGGEEYQIRKNLIENNHIETIIGLPSNIFFGTGIPTVIMVLRQKRDTDDVLIVDASKGFVKEGKNNKLRASDIKRITDTVIGRLTVPGYSRLVPKTEIQEQEYNLNIPRYVDSSEPSESWDLYASMFGGIPVSELDALEEYWKAFPTMRSALFVENGTPYVSLKEEDFKPIIRGHQEVKQFKAAFESAFDDFSSWLSKSLLEPMLTLSIPRQEHLISEELFSRLESLPLIDKYHAYQILADHWRLIAIDLEIIQTEGFEANRVVDPNMVIRKRKGKDTEVQEGWKGRIMPFELVQETYLKDDLEDLRQKEEQLTKITLAIEELVEQFTDEEKAGMLFNEAGDKFAVEAVNKEAKSLKAEAKETGGYAADSFEAKVIEAARLFAAEKKQKEVIKKAANALHQKTKKFIEELTEEQVHELLIRKWITRLNEELHSLPSQQVDLLISKLEALVKKYEITYAENARDIQQAETTLAEMIDEMSGTDFDLKGLAELKNILVGE